MPLQWSEVEAWSRLSGVRLAAFECDVIMQLDDAWAAVVRENRKGR